MRYLSPELLKERIYDYKNDSWGLGVVLYEMLIGEHPFMNENILQMMNNIISGSLDFNHDKWLELSIEA